MNVREWMCTFLLLNVRWTANNRKCWRQKRKRNEQRKKNVVNVNWKFSNGIWKLDQIVNYCATGITSAHSVISLVFCCCCCFISCVVSVIGIIVRSPHWYRFQLVYINDFAIIYILHLMICSVRLSELTSHLAVANSRCVCALFSFFRLLCLLVFFIHVYYRWTLLPLILYAMISRFVQSTLTVEWNGQSKIHHTKREGGERERDRKKCVQRHFSFRHRHLLSLLTSTALCIFN